MVADPDVVRLGAVVDDDALPVGCDETWVDVAASDVKSEVVDEAREELVVDGSDGELELDGWLEPVPVTVPAVV